MILFNLAVLLAERNLKITMVSTETGISRTTLTSLVKNNAQGIQLATINNLCQYLQVTPKELFSYIPFDFSIHETDPYLFINDNGFMKEDEKPNIIPFKLVITQNRIDFDMYLIGKIQLEKSINKQKSFCTITINLAPHSDLFPETTDISRKVYRDFLENLSPQFMRLINERIFDIFEPHYEFFINEDFDSVKIVWAL